MTATLTPRERELARHALGLPNERRQSSRNRFYAPVGSEQNEMLSRLVPQGLCECRRSVVIRPRRVKHDFFTLTRAGAEAALEAGETLDEEDFPK